MNVKRAKFFIAGVIVFGALFYLGVSGFNSQNFVYFLTVDEVAQKARESGLGDRGIRVQGKIVPHSLKRNRTTLEVAFRIQGEKNTLAVRYRGVPPDLLENGFPVIAEGKIDPKGVLVAKNLMVACPSKFEEMRKKGAEIPTDHNSIMDAAMKKKRKLTKN